MTNVISVRVGRGLAPAGQSKHTNEPPSAVVTLRITGGSKPPPYIGMLN